MSHIRMSYKKLKILMMNNQMKRANLARAAERSPYKRDEDGLERIGYGSKTENTILAENIAGAYR